jgi:YbbR domain-containing protein
MMRRSLTANLQWKLLALALAATLWFVVVGEPELVTSQSAPIFYKDLPRDLEIGSDVPDRVHLEIRGPAASLKPDRLSDTAVLVDLSQVQKPGELTVTVTSASIDLPAGVTLLRAVPSQLRLRFDRVLEKEIPVQVRPGSAPPPGYAIAGEEVVPSMLRISGPEVRVRQIEAAQTDPVDLSSVVGHSEFHVHAFVVDPRVRFVGSPVVTVRVDVVKK